MTAVTTDVEVVAATATATTTAVAMAAATTMEAHAPIATDLGATIAMVASVVEVATAAVATTDLLVAHHRRPALLMATLELHLLAAATKTVVVATRSAAKVWCRLKWC